jgi:hypothetical protein
MKINSMSSSIIKYSKGLIIVLSLAGLFSCTSSVCPTYADRNLILKTSLLAGGNYNAQKIASPFTEKHTEKYKKKLQKTIKKTNRNNFFVRK